LTWVIEYSDTAKKQLRKLDKTIAKRIVDFMDNSVAARGYPRNCGKALKGQLGELWRYRIGDYRVICKIQDEVLRVLVIEVGHRKEVYR